MEYIVSTNHKIEKVPSFVRENNKGNDYDPEVVSIGPYHHGKSKLQFVEKFKFKVLEANLLSFTDLHISYFDFKFMDVIDKIRQCYSAESTNDYKDNDVARMMLLDANFVLSYMESTMPQSEQVKDLFVRNLGFVTYFTIQRDVFLLENQIPLWILKMLMALKYGSSGADEMLLEKNLFGRFCGSVVFCDYEPIIRWIGECGQQFHLLEYLRDLIVSKPIPKVFESSIECGNLEPMSTHIYPFRSVRDLKQKGIFFRLSNTNSLQAIKFKSYVLFGKLHLPREHISMYSQATYANMIAYEMSPNTETRYEVTSYVNFMKSLVVGTEDVKELRENGVICNHMGTDEEAAKVFLDVTTYDVVSHGGTLVDVIKEMQSHVSSRWKTSIAECYWTYFSTPWTIIALLAAITLLCLSVMQTHYTMYPMN